MLAGVALIAGVVAGASSGEKQSQSSAKMPAQRKPAAPSQLPGGGRRLFPDRRVVAFYGSPRDPQLGALGVGRLGQALARLHRQARPYARRTRPILPALELISTLATAAPGPGELYRDHLPDGQIARYLRAARREHALLVLDIQPGRSDFLSETQRLERWLREPDVALAVDPEWRVHDGELPGKVIGSTDADELNGVTAWLAALVQRLRLPEKLFVVHQFTPDMVRDQARVLPRRGLAMTFNVDGFGTPPAKRSKYREFTDADARFHHGFKLFYEEDTELLAPRQVMGLAPRPDLVVYE